MKSNPGATAPAIRWTREQEEAITDRGRDLFVTAAAGSGKTAVLTERVFRLITEKRGGEAIPLERLLVITFTRKAARQMRERIEASIVAGLGRDENSAELRAALDALPRSNILTLDAFCDRLVRRHFHQAGVSPGVRVADEEEERDLVHAVTQRVFEELARADSADHGGREFALLVTVTERGMHPSVLDALAARVHRIREFMASLERPYEWAERLRADLAASLSAKSYDELPEARRAEAAIAVSLVEFADALDHLAEYADTLCGEGAREKTSAWRSTLQGWRDLAARADFPSVLPSHFLHEVAEYFSSPAAAPLLSLQNKGSCGGALYAREEFREQSLEKFSKKLKSWLESWFAIDAEHWLHSARMAAEQSLALLNLAERIERETQLAKRRRGVLGFADIERKALELLTGPGGSASEVAVEYQNYFASVLVDEYQDISPLQDAIIRRLSHTDDPAPEAERNLFVVGDVKQSIYRFRRADPTLFASRLAASPSEVVEDSPRRRISLRSNFRSLPGILECANAIFERLMDRNLGGIDYDEEARFVAERCDELGGDAIRVEVHWIDPKAAAVASEDAEGPNSVQSNEGGNDDEESEDAAAPLQSIEREASWIASRILELTSESSGAFVPDERAPGGKRRARPADCAILVRKLSTDSELWVATLAKFGLRVRSAGRDSRLSTPEMSDVIAALRLADNPLQDIPLAIVLRSPMVGLSDEDLLKLRLADRHAPFHDAVMRAARSESPDAEPHVRKLKESFAKADRWRILAARSTPEDVLDAILNDTGYAAHLGGLPNGVAKQRSLDFLRRLMRNHTGRTMSASGLSDFLRALDGFGDRPGAADDSDEGAEDDGAVHLLTIHKSKGLEFPIVFFARLASPFGSDRARDAMELSSAGGMSLCAVDPERRLRLKTPGFTAMREQERRASRAEELRLMYVAMTRARERLILVGSLAVGSIEERFANSPPAHGSVLPVFTRLTASHPAALLGPMLHRVRAETVPPWLRISIYETVPPSPAATELPRIREALMATGEMRERAWRLGVDEFVTNFQRDERAEPIVSALREGRYAKDVVWPKLIVPNTADGGIHLVKMITAVTEFPLRPGGDGGDSDADIDPREIEAFGEADAVIGPTRGRSASSSRRPRFAQGATTLDGIGRGKLVHSFLQHVNLRGGLDEEGLRVQARELWDRGLFEIEDFEALEAIPFGGVEKFFRSELGERMRARPGSIIREFPLVRWKPAIDLYTARAPLTPHAREALTAARGLVRGVIDCVLDEGSHVVLIDYKTGLMRNQNSFEADLERYLEQMSQYRSALRTIWRVNVSEAYLVFLDAGKNVLVSDPEEAG